MRRLYIMKRVFIVLALLATVLPCQAAPQKGDIGVGAILSDPIQFSAKKWLSRTTAIDGAFRMEDKGGRDSSGTAYELHVDYLKHDFGVFKNSSGRLPVHYGLGIKLEDDREFTTSIRAPIGISFFFKEAPVSVFFEYALLLDVSSSSPSLSSETAFGARYYF
jgi:hypothetical protein